MNAPQPTIEYRQAIEKLWNHANLLERGLSPEDSFVYTLLDADKNKTQPDLQRLYTDVLCCITAVNVEINGALPSETIGGSRELDRTLCYCMSGILSNGWSYYLQWRRSALFETDFLDSFAGTLVRIGFAWGLLLAGDIDDIVAETEHEFSIRHP